MDKIGISVIVPVYNVEKFLDRCIISIINQTYTNIEIILINDGSTDTSFEICKKYQMKDNRIILIDKENEGLGLTRNRGLEIARGEYVTFIDSDDYIDNNMLQELYCKIKEFKCDMISSNFIYNGIVLQNVLFKELYIDKEIQDIVLMHMFGNLPKEKQQLSATSCGKLYSLEIIKKNKLRFPSERRLIWEDLVFNISFLCECTSVYMLNRAYYHYDYNDNSLTHRYQHNKFVQIVKMYQYLIEQIRKINLPKEAEERLNNLFVGHVITCLKLEVFYARDNGIKYAYKNVKDICSSEYVIQLLKNHSSIYNSLKQKIYSILILRKYYKLVYVVTYFQNKMKKII